MIELKFTGHPEEVMSEMKKMLLGGIVTQQQAAALVQMQRTAPTTEPAPAAPEAGKQLDIEDAVKAAEAKPKRGRPAKKAEPHDKHEVPEDVRMETTAPLEMLSGGAVNAGDGVTASEAAPAAAGPVAPAVPHEITEMDVRVVAYRLLNAAGPKVVERVFAACGVASPKVGELPKEKHLEFVSRAKQALDEYLATIDGGAKAELLARLDGVEAKIRGAK